ncbi:MAG: bifunctional phosphopantothenoylcysteine decarboxylase/phosphopantothenate--cysteine ligase CoaBC [Gammaproteobacteria bacterium]|nr:bifunctional phosphopantothenoylcysteine decarboxylase/phosphopantothenate--cysteine ligase CoaBC [Gammaproteobacteria bacterium]NIR82728.1 bifunctional phosphopantothenoylcysteine decarboxylase/phosphopantothenate--cysteine ligase CoaBC [Gammaproteobacteria bacterium]NIR89592.1 bifunctional phosphopantothenoylcysteine decarboxylase/phosphopantothenate--cysteine ligase CoaBC [Gammaproteobacteria bacterium]NIU03888.1 bifunctional phosphopantothenoylcysteine decarboxylase/phosphopantothenate--c
MRTPSNKAPVPGQLVLGVSGGVAAYKSADLVRRLREQDCEVRVVMTRAARRFITPLTMQAVSGHPVHTELLDPAAEAGMGHIELARWADVVLIAPASADVMAKLAHGLADDLLSTLCLATSAPLVLAPAMNQQMWNAAATQANRWVLEERGVRFLGPGEGAQACGETGPGRMLDPLDIVRVLLHGQETGPLAGLSVLVTAGPTRESLDPVRFISNHSSGKMGYAIARAAVEAGAEVTLVSGPTTLSAPAGVTRVAVTSGREMYEAVMREAGQSDVFIAAAAVSDYRPDAFSASKIKKGDERIALSLVPNPDILTEVAALAGGPLTVGFAAETENVEQHALEKLHKKSLDLIAANQVGPAGVGFASDENALLLLWEGGRRELPRASKAALARDLVRVIADRYHARHGAAEDPGSPSRD